MDGWIVDQRTVDVDHHGAIVGLKVLWGCQCPGGQVIGLHGCGGKIRRMAHPDLGRGDMLLVLFCRCDRVGRALAVMLVGVFGPQPVNAVGQDKPLAAKAVLEVIEPLLFIVVDVVQVLKLIPQQHHQVVALVNNALSFLLLARGEAGLLQQHMLVTEHWIT